MRPLHPVFFSLHLICTASRFQSICLRYDDATREQPLPKAFSIGVIRYFKIVYWTFRSRKQRIQIGLVCGLVGQRKKQKLLKGLRGVEHVSCSTVDDNFRVPKWQMDLVFNSTMISRAEDALLNISGYRASFSAEVTTGFVLAMRDIASLILWEWLSLLMILSPDIYRKSHNSVSWQNDLILAGDPKEVNKHENCFYLRHLIPYVVWNGKS